MFESLSRRTLAPYAILIVPVVLAAAMYARFFGGFWLGDDFPNLYVTWLAAQRGELLAQVWAELTGSGPWRGDFYRPAMMASLSFSQWLARDRFAGWFAFSYAVHLANVGLVGVLVARLAAACRCDGRASGAIAAAFFAVCPLLAEGVFWISARADACVTLCTLAGLFFWAAPRREARAWLGLPLLLMPGLGFKESAAVLPLQMLIVTLGWPTRPTRGQLLAVGASFALAIAFLGFRTHLFGNAWQVYPSVEAVSPSAKLWQGIQSLGAWWDGLTHATPAMAVAYLVACTATIFVAGASTKGGARRLAAALTIASGGLAAATLLNLGALVPNGEGGRLSYGPVAWLALALGVALSRPMDTGIVIGKSPLVRMTGLSLLATTVATGIWVLEGELREARSTQDEVRDMTLAVWPWTSTHTGITLLIIPEMHGPVVANRNGQVALILPPLQPQPLWHRIVPTMPVHIPTLYDQLAAGHATRLESIRPSTADAEVLRRLFEPDVPRWPEHYACWDATSRRIVELPAPDPRGRAPWVSALRREIARCGL